MRLMILHFLLLVCSAWLARAEVFISVDESCYESSNTILVHFENTGAPRPRGREFIALLFAENLNLNALDGDDIAAWVAWVGDCDDSPDCPRTGGVVEFQPSRQLQSGQYRVVLTAGIATPYPVRALSSVFTILPPGQHCGNRDNHQDIEQDQPTGHDLNIGMRDTISRATADIQQIIMRNKPMGAKFLRLAFHDCVGGCDGCVDFENPDNAGLEDPIQTLNPIVQKYQPTGLSRTDVWMLSAVVASDTLQPENEQRIDFPFQWIGRKTCQELYHNDCGNDFFGNPTDCSETTGPHHELPHPDSGTNTLLEFFDIEFGFNPKQVVAIMGGGHSIGGMRRNELGFSGTWDLTNEVLDHGYYVELAGKDNGSVPDWQQVQVDNTDLRIIPNRIQWQAQVDGRTMVMINSDMALVRHLQEGVNLEKDGKVSCPFMGMNKCPDATETFPHIIAYSKDRQAFLRDYQQALDLMIDNGYQRTRQCPQFRVCTLQVA